MLASVPLLADANYEIAIDTTTITLCEALQAPIINANIIKPRGGYSVKKLRGIVEACYEAGKQSPSLGSPAVAALKWISICYCESGLHPYRSHTNSNGTVDIGIAQVNSAHWTHPPKMTTWMRFCDLNGIKPDFDSLYDVRINLLFASYVNEMLYNQKNVATNLPRPGGRISVSSIPIW